MSIRIGADIGGTSVKLICMDDENRIITSFVYDKDDSADHFEREINRLISVSGADTDMIYTTGVGSGIISSMSSKFRSVYVNEFEAFGRGAQILSGRDRILAVSIGTGTAFVKADGSDYKHLGGSGIGGGTFGGLCKRLIGTGNIYALKSMLVSGNASKVDLTVGDISNGDLSGIDPSLTASNFGKPVGDCCSEDIAAGAANMVYQSAGVMAALACKGTDISTAVFVGAMSAIPFGRKVLAEVGSLHGYDFIVPDNCVFAGAVGSAARGIVK